MHFTESQYIHKFYTLSDVFATIGGLLSSVTLVATQVGGVYIMYFLIRLTGILQQNQRLTFKIRLINFFELFNDKIKHLFDLNKKK